MFAWHVEDHYLYRYQSTFFIDLFFNMMKLNGAYYFFLILIMTVLIIIIVGHQKHGMAFQVMQLWILKRSSGSMYMLMTFY